MILRIVSRVQPHHPTGGEPTVAASVEALLTLSGSNCLLVRTSDLLHKADYQEVWATSIKAVWAVFEASRRVSPTSGPDLVLLYSYSLYVLCAQILTVHRFLDRCRVAYPFTQIEIEDARQLDSGQSVHFPSAAFSSYFHDVAECWALARGIPVITISSPSATGEPAPPPADPRVRSYARRSAVLRLLRGTRQQVARGLALARVLLFLLSGGRRLIFLVANRASGLSVGGSPDVVDVSPFQGFLRWLGRTDRPTRAPVDEGQLRQALCGVDAAFGAYTGLIAARVQRRLDHTLDQAWALWLGTQRVVGWLARCRVRPAFVGSAALVEFQEGAYLADAIRQAGHPVGSVQHGGNMRLYSKGGTPMLYTDFLGGLFFQWGPANTDEHTPLGISHPCRYVSTGSPRTAELLALRYLRRSVPGKRKRIIYAPTAVSVAMTYGTQVPWDRYAEVVSAVCEILNASGHECIVKILATPESDALRLWRFPNLVVLREGGFVDHMWSADYLVIDSLGGSPLYEALATDRPIVCYTAIEHQEWNEEFLKALRKRVVCCGDASSYLQLLRRFVQDPDGVLSATGVQRTSELRERYLPPVEAKPFWATIRAVLASHEQWSQAGSRDVH